MLIIYTGNGKGKTTAALGSACRALGRGKRVLMVQFIKSKEYPSGEDKIALKFGKNFTFRKMGIGFVGILGDKKPFSAHQKAAREALAFARCAIVGGQYDVAILDEVNVAVDLKLIKPSEALDAARQAPETMILIFTGRGAPASFLKRADLVTEMREIKHPFQKKKRALLCVEF